MLVTEDGCAVLGPSAGEVVPSERGHVFTPLEMVIRLHLPELFPGLELESATMFRVSRNSEYEIEDEEVEDEA